MSGAFSLRPWRTSFCPIDAVPDIIAGIGFTDDAAVVATVLGMFARHVTVEHKEKASRRLDELLA